MGRVHIILLATYGWSAHYFTIVTIATHMQSTLHNNYYTIYYCYHSNAIGGIHIMLLYINIIHVNISYFGKSYSCLY